MKAISISTWKRLGAMAIMASLLTAFVLLFLLPQDTMASPRQDVAQVTATTAWQESFETDGIGSRYTVTEECTDGSGDYFIRSDGANIGSFVEFTGIDGSYFYAAQDTDGTPECTLTTEVITFTAIPISGYSNIQFTGAFAEDDDGANQDWDDNSLVYVEYNIDGGGWTKFLQFASQGATNTEPGLDTNFDGVRDGDPLTAIFTDFAADIVGTGNSLELRLTIANLDAGDEDIAFDNFRLAVPSFTINKSVLPASIGYQENVTYTVVLDNGTAVSDTNVLFTDTLPVEVDFASWVEQPAGAIVTADEITWSGTVTATDAITFTFIVSHTGNYGDVVTNTASFSGTIVTGTAEAAFTVADAASDITFIYHDLEDVVQAGETVYIAGEFNSWTPSLLTADATLDTFTATVPSLAAGTYEYKYIVNDGSEQWDWLNTVNRSYTVAGNATIDDYRNVNIGWANLDTPASLNTETYSTTASVYGQVYIQNITNPAGEGRGIMAEVGFGTDADPSLWNWFPMSYDSDMGNNDYFSGTMTTGADVGVFSYTTRYAGNWDIGNPNAVWVYGDLDGMPFSLDQAGVMTSTLGDSPADRLIINELDADTSGTEVDEFIELYDDGVGSTDLTGLVVVLFNGSNDQSYNPVFDLDGYSTNSDGYFVICGSSNVPNCDLVADVDYFLQNGADAAALFIGDAADFPNGTPVTTANLVDAIVYGTSDADDSGLLVLLNAGQPQVNENSRSTAFSDSNQRCLNGAGGARNTNTYIQELPTAGAANDCPLPELLITKTAPALVEPGELYAYTLTVENNLGYDLTGVVITDMVPISSTYASGGSLVGDTVEWTVPTLANYASIVQTFAVTATTVDGTAIVNLDYGVNASNYITVSYGSPITTSVAGAGCGASYTPIYTIQGNGINSSLDGVEVYTEGVITAVYQDANQLNGFYIQDETGDGDVTTSDGVFVYSSTPVTVTDAVRVRGTIDEYYDLTEITSVSSIQVCGTGTITPTSVSLPVATLDTWEQYEGMLLDFPQGLYATETYVLGRYGEVSLSVNDRLYNPTNIATPGAAAIAQQELNDRSRIQLDDTYTDQNRDPIAYPGAGLTYTNTLRGGDYVANLTGVLDYAYGVYKVQPVGAVDFVATNIRTVAPENVGGTLNVASFNVLNYFNGDGQGGGFPTSRGAESLFEFDRQRIKIINAIVAIDADIIGLMEIENDGYGSFGAIQDLVNGLNDATAAGTYAFVDPGVSAIGTDEIAVGLLYKPANVSLIGSPAILDSSVISTFNDLKNRPALAQSFMENATEGVVTVAVNHLKSKGSDCNDIGDPDTGDGQGNCNLTRESAAEALVTWLATDPTSSGSAYSLIIGDLNSYAMEDPITAITDAGYTNLLSEFGGMYAYSYVFDGQHGYLDHGLASPALMPFVTGANTWHINSDEPISLDYNVNFKTANQLITLYGEGPYRASDHDPVVIGLHMATINITSPISGTTFTAMDNVSVTVPITVATPGFDIAASGGDGHWHIWLDGSMDHMVYDYGTELVLPIGEHTIMAQLVDNAHQPLGPEDTVTVMVLPLEINITSPISGTEFVAVNNMSATVPVTVSTPNFTIPTNGYWEISVDGGAGVAVMDYATVLDVALGEHTILATLMDNDDNPLGPTDTVTITVVPVDGIIITSPISGTEFVAMNNISATVPVTVTTPGFIIPTDGHWHVWVDGSMDHMVYDYGTELLLPVGEHTITAQLVDNAHQPLGPEDTIVITVRAWQNQIIYLPVIMK